MFEFFDAKAYHICACDSTVIFRATKVNNVKFILPFLKLMKRRQTKFHAHIMRKSQVIRSKKVKIYN